MICTAQASGGILSQVETGGTDAPYPLAVVKGSV